DFSYKLFETLKCVSKTFSQRQAAKRLGISHAVLNRRIKDAESKLGFLLVKKTGAGSELTINGRKLLKEHETLMKRFNKREKPIICGGHVSTDLMDILCRDFGLEATIYSTDDESALKLAEMGMIDILTLDDPVHAFMHDLDFFPLAYDHLVLVSSSGVSVENVEELKCKNFVEVPHSAQRLAWNTLDQLKIDYNIIQLCNSPQTALRMVKDGEDIYSFINRSLTTGGEILSEDTHHLLTFVLYSKDRILKEFSDYISGRGQQIVQKRGFERI
ncbi:MAG TPA: LysR family transcriptional regulator, partial [Methanobacteriaceae archaeon]|nr:LysR family transcriptional regulator [Methanobacteriaceae archaeon]